MRETDRERERERETDKQTERGRRETYIQTDRHTEWGEVIKCRIDTKMKSFLILCRGR